MECTDLKGSCYLYTNLKKNERRDLELQVPTILWNHMQQIYFPLTSHLTHLPLALELYTASLYCRLSPSLFDASLISPCAASPLSRRLLESLDQGRAEGEALDRDPPLIDFGGPKLIKSLSSVEFLRLEFDGPEQKVHKKDFSNCPVFNNLKRLELVSWILYVFDLPPYFLHHSRKLQELTLENKNAWVIEVLLEETTPEGPSDALVQREFLVERLINS